MKPSLILLATLASLASANLSGIVQTGSGAGLSGVVVSLKRSPSLTATTSASGQWSLSTTAIAPRSVLDRTLTPNLLLQDGRLLLNLKGASPDGRRLSGPSPTRTSLLVAGRTTAAAVDTLVFTLGG